MQFAICTNRGLAKRHIKVWSVEQIRNLKCNVKCSNSQGVDCVILLLSFSKRRIGVIVFSIIKIYVDKSCYKLCGMKGGGVNVPFGQTGKRQNVVH